MKKHLIASLVGALIIFFWQFLSNAALDLHKPGQQYTAKQDSILQYLGTNLEPGKYMLPRPKPGCTMEEQQKFMTDYNGKPWAVVDYHASFNQEDMPMNMLRGFLVNIVIVWLLVWLLTLKGNLTFMQIFLSSVAVGLIGFLNISYTNHIWYPSADLWINLLDAGVEWAATGLWLGWYLNRIR